MRYFSYFCVLILNLILQSTLFEHIAIVGVKPNTMLIIVVSIALMRGEIEGAVVGAFAGLLQDCFFSFYIGSYVFLGMMLGYLCGVLCKSLYRENFIVPIIVVAVATMIFEFCYYAINILLQGYTQLWYFFRTVMLPEIVYNAIVTIFLYLLLLKLNDWLEGRERHIRYRKKNILLK